MPTSERLTTLVTKGLFKFLRTISVHRGRAAADFLLDLGVLPTTTVLLTDNLALTDFGVLAVVFGVLKIAFLVEARGVSVLGVLRAAVFGVLATAAFLAGAGVAINEEMPSSGKSAPLTSLPVLNGVLRPFLVTTGVLATFLKK